METTFLATLGQVFARLIEMHGIDTRQLMREAGIDPKVLRDPEARISNMVGDAVSARVAALIPDPAFALHAARCWHPSNLGALGHAWLTSSTLRTGLKRLVRYGRLHDQRAQYRLLVERDGLRFAYDHRSRDPVARAVGTDFAFSIIMDMCRMNYGAALRPMEVRLTRTRPAITDPWKHFYGCPVHFGARGDSILLSRSVADEALSSANRRLAIALDGILEKQLAALDWNSLPARCKAILFEQMTSGEISEIGMARALHMSRRTLQRRLTEVNLGYRQLLDNTRRDLALQYLDDPQKSVTDITFLLGFAGQSALTRAFRRWTGISPSVYRSQKSVAAAA